MLREGVLVVDKPAGPTSFDVVQRVRAVLGVKKAGHTGTLDPMATGVLPICLGEATKLQGFITEGDKSYDAAIRLGIRTDTQDAQGRELSRVPVPALTNALLEDVLARFRGPQKQTPPMFSAVKVGGKRLHTLARAGQEVARTARDVTVHALTLREFSEDQLQVSVSCTKGFYVRTLAEDLGNLLGCGAHLQALRRTRSGPFALSHSVTLEALPGLAAGKAALPILGPEESLSHLPEVQLDALQAMKVLHGASLTLPLPPGRVRLTDSSHRLLSVAECHPGGRLEYLRVFRRD